MRRGSSHDAVIIADPKGGLSEGERCGSNGCA